MIRPAWMDFIFTALDGRTRSAREMWRQMQATRFHKANPKLKVNTHVLCTADPPEVIFKFVDESEVGTLFAKRAYGARFGSSF
jgi:hypothetical protein